jgi:WD40 repeat protein/predicted Ser/Thr protein kinase
MVWNAGQPLFGGRYIIDRQLGEGGIGITYLVKNSRGELRVVKTLKEEILNHPAWILHRNKLRQDFRDEAVRLAVCRHPHVVQIETVFDEGNLPCIVMEYIEGEDLGKYLRRWGILPEAEALLYIQQIGDALSLIHSRGLLHRDLKPRNIMVRSPQSDVVLIDFGIAREFIPNVIQRHTVYRTPGFAPPEQYELEAPRGEFIDIYALAATLYNLLTGVVPTSADDRSRNIPLEAPKNFNSKISSSVNRAILQGMDLESIYRPQSMQEWLALLNSHTEENPPTLQLPTIGVGSQSWQCVQSWKGHSSMVHAIAIAPDGQLIVSGSNDNTLKLWQIGSGKLVRQFGRWFSGHTESVWSVAFSPCGQFLASGSWDKTIKLWQVYTGKIIYTFSGHSNWVNSVVFSPDGQFIASGSADCTMKLWQVKTGKEIHTFTGHSDAVCSVAWSPDGQFIATASADYTIKLWQVHTGGEICTLQGHSFFVNSLAWSSDSQFLASGSSDKTIKLWQVETGKEIATLSGHTNSVVSVAWSKDGQLLASGSWDNRIKIWQVQRAREICTLSEHTSYVRIVAFSPDGQTLVSGSDDDTIKVWGFRR